MKAAVFQVAALPSLCKREMQFALLLSVVRSYVLLNVGEDSRGTE